MYDQLIHSLKEKISLSPEEIDKIIPHFSRKKVRKRHFVLNEGDVCKFNFFVEKGLLRSFTVEEDGYEQVVQFAVEGWWISDLGSFFSGDPADYSIEALEDSDLLSISRESLDEMVQVAPIMERYFRLLMQNHIIAQQRRIIATLRLSAEERYLRFMKASPSLINRIPQQYIASFLGMTPETLSRVRKQASDPGS